MTIFNKCLSWLLFHPEDVFIDTSTLIQLRELAAEKLETSRKYKKIDMHFFHK